MYVCAYSANPFYIEIDNVRIAYLISSLRPVVVVVAGNKSILGIA